MSVAADTAQSLALGLVSLSLDGVVTIVIAIALGAIWLTYRIRMLGELRELQDALRAMTRGDRTRRIHLTLGPLKPVGDAVNDFAESVTRRLTDAELAQTELEQMVSLDRLTGIGNRRHFEQQLELEAARGKRYGVPVSIVLLDIDHFKRINDTYGHAVGDSVLIDITRRVSSQLRDTDSISRWGGEEFAVIAPCTPMPGAEILAEKLREAVAEQSFDIVGHVTISAGVAQLLPGERARHWVARADRFLYQAKQLGRNRVCAHAVAPRSSAPFVLVWGEQFMTGNETVDAEHAEVFRLANDVILMDPNAPPEQLLERFDALLSAVTHHFSSEESILRDVGCPEHELEDHAADHQGLAASALVLRQKLANGQVGLDEVGDFIVRRIAVGHLVRTDLPLFATLTTSATLPIDASGPTSLRMKIQRALIG